jgi:hypothetical protein
VGCIQGAISLVLSANCNPRFRELKARVGVLLYGAREAAFVGVGLLGRDLVGVDVAVATLEGRPHFWTTRSLSK